jgi:hypothetical protein
MDLNLRPAGPEPENQKFISAASVAYGIAGHLFPLLNWIFGNHTMQGVKVDGK